MRILLVEDSARLRDLLSEAVRSEGWRIDAFETAQEGRLALRDSEYDLVLLDCRATINVEFERQSGWDFAGGGRNGVRA